MTLQSLLTCLIQTALKMQGRMNVPPSIIYAGNLILSYHYSWIDLIFFLSWTIFLAISLFTSTANLKCKIWSCLRSWWYLSYLFFLPRTHTCLSFMPVSNQREEIYKAANFDVRRMSDLPSVNFFCKFIIWTTVFKETEKIECNVLFVLLSKILQIGSLYSKQWK